jgi:hypothetical protein
MEAIKAQVEVQKEVPEEVTSILNQAIEINVRLCGIKMNGEDPFGLKPHEFKDMLIGFFKEFKEIHDKYPEYFEE